MRVNLMKKKKLLVVQLAGFGTAIAERMQTQPGNITFHPLGAVFPAVTCVAQASLRTGTPPSAHGMIANGVYHERLKKILFWEQAASLIHGPRIWDPFRASGGTVGMMFWQQSLGESVDLVVSPRPIHKHNGGMIQDVYTQPVGLYEKLRKRIGRNFNLMHYWGPVASRKSTEWIVEAISAVLHDPEIAPDLLLAYLPHLDYDLQRHGPQHARVKRAISELETYITTLHTRAQQAGYDVLFAGDYAIKEVQHGALFPNGALRIEDLFLTQTVKGMAYPDLFNGKAFAMVDHEVAHVFVPDTSALDRARRVLADLEGVEHVLDREAQREWGINHPHSGDLVLIAEDGYWFAYPWWTDRREAPDFATHVDIHNKPGFDPCELFFGWPPGAVSQDTTRIKGSHGRIGPDRRIAWGGTITFDEPPTDLAALGRSIGQWLARD
jgi:predicted AlkP superfamily pyrophosphatase or phosphodiesterase